MDAGKTVDLDALPQALARFKLTGFRPGQREVIETLLGGRDVLCVMPTGGGKSLCYQLPSLLLDGITVVVSPLIALMKDQEDQLRRLGIQAAALHSGLDPSEINERLAAIEQRVAHLCYVAPERLRSARFLEALNRAGVAILAIDEAHCISEWGHDFRPDYARLGWFREKLGNPTTIALTATATDVVRRDIVEQLRLVHPGIFVRGFDRPNLHYSVRPVRSKNDKLRALEEIDEAVVGSKIVYAASRKQCEEAGEYLLGRGKRRVAIYHAGLLPHDRRQSQDAFMSGQKDIIVATNAFGMGVDKPDIRAVIHFNLPGTLEAYYQEAGRAGRDGKPAECELLYSPSDRYIQEFFIDGEYPSRALVLNVLEFLRSLPSEVIELTRQEMRDRLGSQTSEMAIGAAIKLLEAAGVVERLRPRENMAILRIHETGPDLGDLLPASAKNQIRVVRHLDRLVGRRRGEDVYFQPSHVADELGMDRAAFASTIRELSSRMQLDYIPPFRGSATRVLDRETPAHRIAIDFESLEERKQREYAKLERMIDYAQSSLCRRMSILQYFGEQAEACGHCDNCDHLGIGPPSEGAAHSSPLASADIPAKAVQWVQLVVQAASEMDGRVGKTTLAAALCGSKSQKAGRFGMTKRVWHGAFSSFKQKDVLDLVHALQSVGLIEQRGDAMRPTVGVGSRGEAFLSGTESLPMRFPFPPAMLSKLSSSHDSAPSSRATPLAPAMSSTEPVTELSDPEEIEWTCQVLDAGFDLRACAAIRRLSFSMILDQLQEALEQGRTWPAEALDAPLGEPRLDERRQSLKDELCSRLTECRSPSEM